jgi:hypothetical protein
MIRIVGVNRSPDPQREFVLLQNQGAMRATLRGHAILGETEDGFGAMHVFDDDETVPTGKFVILFTGCGVPRWAKTRDGAYVYHCYLGQDRSLWHEANGPIHLLNTQHTYQERKPADLLRI